MEVIENMSRKLGKISSRKTIRADCKNRAKCGRRSYYYCLNFCGDRQMKTCGFLYSINKTKVSK